MAHGAATFASQRQRRLSQHTYNAKVEFAIRDSNLAQTPVQMKLTGILQAHLVS
jgi:hypothetical protein